MLLSEEIDVWLMVTVVGLDDREVWTGLVVSLTRVEVVWIMVVLLELVDSDCVIISEEIVVVWIEDCDCVVLSEEMGVWLMVTVVTLDD